MKKIHFVIIFVTGEIKQIFASTIREAQILAQAKQIEAGNNYDIKHNYYFDNSMNKIKIKK